MPIIDALTNNTGGFFQVNVPNQGGPIHASACMCWWLRSRPGSTGRASPPLRPKQLPKKIMLEQIWPKVIEMERELEAYKTGDRSMLLYNAINSPQTHSYEQAVAVLEDLLAMEGHEEMNVHFSGPRAADSPALRRITPRDGDRTAADK